MDKQQYQAIIDDQTGKLIETLLPNGASAITAERLKFALDAIAQVAFREGKNYGLSGIMTADQVAEIVGVSPRRIRAILKTRHDRFGTGRQIGSTWTIHIDELDNVRPGPEGWPKGKARS